MNLEAHYKFILETMDRQNAIARNVVAELEAENARLKAEVNRLNSVDDSEDYEDEVSLKSEVEILKSELKSANERLDRFRDEYSKLNQKLERKSEALRECLAVSKIILDGFSDPKFSLSVAHLRGLVDAWNNPEP